jgi:hypothetical protein
VEVLADDYTSKGDEDMIEVKIGDDMIFVEKKFVKILTDEIDPAITDKKVESIDEDDDDDDSLNLDFGDLEDDDDDTFSFDMDDVDIEDDDDDDDDEEPVAVPSEEPAAAPSEEPTVEPQPMNKDNEMVVLQAKLKKSLAELEDLRSDMKNTFTSSDTLGNTITSLRGMLDALKKDQMDMLSKGQ